MARPKSKRIPGSKELLGAIRELFQEEYGITYEDFAQLVGKHRTAVHDWINNSGVSSVQAKDVCEKLKIPIEVFYIQGNDALGVILEIVRRRKNDSESDISDLMDLLKEIENPSVFFKPKTNEIKISSLIGEIQFYESLNAVLDSGEINCLDVTYFSQKLPFQITDTRVNNYWGKILNLLRANKIQIRRTICIDDSDQKNEKLNWILFGLIPSYYEYIENGKASFSIFRVSQLVNIQRAFPINLINMILMYNIENPDKGHIWFFGSHTKHGAGKEYIYMNGEKNIRLFQSIFSELFDSGAIVGDDIIKALLLKKKEDLNSSNIDKYLSSKSNYINQFSINDSQKNYIFAKYKKFFEQ